MFFEIFDQSDKTHFKIEVREGFNDPSHGNIPSRGGDEGTEGDEGSEGSKGSKGSKGSEGEEEG